MGRTTKANSKFVLAILTSDWHLRETQPICRTDDFWETQWEKVTFIAALQEQYQCPVLHAGDLFHHWKPSPYLLSKTIQHLPDEFHTVYGQHDLPQHNFELRNKSGIATLEEAGKLSILAGRNYGQEKAEDCNLFYDRPTLIMHQLVWTGKVPWPGCTDPNADLVLAQNPQFSLIVTGDNHKPFVVTSGKRTLVNPGSITRQTADQVDHKPRVYLWRSESNTVEPVYLPIKEGVVSREHLDKTQERDERIEAFISRLNDDWEVGLSFEENLRRFEQENKVRASVMAIIRKAMEQ